MISLTVNQSKLRNILLIGACLMGSFAFIDLGMMPESLHTDYLFSRFALQIPTVLAMIAFTFHKNFVRYEQPAILLMVTFVTFANYWLIMTCWTKEQFAFSYEGTLLYTFFAFFIMRINFKFGLAYVFLSLLGFGGLILLYPVYGEYNSVNFGFVAMAQIICLYGLYSLSGSLQTISDLTAKLQEMSRVDQLSGLFNRRAYEHDGKLLFEHAKRSDQTVSIFMIDIDNFKDYNDAYGHQKGDEAIRIQAQILKSVFGRDGDIIGRYGGEEFIVIVTNIDAKASKMKAQKILDAWKEEKVVHGRGSGGKYLSCSIGIMNLTPNKQLTFEGMIGLADEALFKAKNDGRNRYLLASSND